MLLNDKSFVYKPNNVLYTKVKSEINHTYDYILCKIKRNKNLLKYMEKYFQKLKFLLKKKPIFEIRDIKEKFIYGHCTIKFI